jgi:phosphoribosylformylglycinamidine cyclo-ligase
MKKKSAYAGAGVDIELGNRVKESLPDLLASTNRPEVLGQVGGFGGLFALNTAKYKQPVLVSSVDGVGTKLKVAFQCNRHETIGQDLVNHCVNDIAVLGAEPLFFLDYLGTGTLKPHVFSEIMKGFAVGCLNNGCALIGGETAQMPGFYQKGEYDVSGTVVGVVDRKRMLNGQKSIRQGDVIIGLGASGLHTNGYSLARKVLFDKMGLSVRRKVKELGCSVGDELLKVHVSYWSLLQALLTKFNPSGQKAAIKGLAHITGGGFIDNIPRVLPANCDAAIQRGSWSMLPIFDLLQREGRIDEEEMYQAFNMGIGMVVVVAAESAPTILRSIKARKQPAWVIGEVRKGSGRTVLL